MTKVFHFIRDESELHTCDPKAQMMYVETFMSKTKSCSPRVDSHGDELIKAAECRSRGASFKNKCCDIQTISNKKHKNT